MTRVASTAFSSCIVDKNIIDVLHFISIVPPLSVLEVATSVRAVDLLARVDSEFLAAESAFAYVAFVRAMAPSEVECQLPTFLTAVARARRRLVFLPAHFADPFLRRALESIPQLATFPTAVFLPIVRRLEFLLAQRTYLLQHRLRNASPLIIVLGFPTTFETAVDVSRAELFKVRPARRAFPVFVFAKRDSHVGLPVRPAVALLAAIPLKVFMLKERLPADRTLLLSRLSDIRALPAPAAVLAIPVRRPEFRPAL